MTLKQMQNEASKRIDTIIGIATDKPTNLTKQLLDNYSKAYKSITGELKDIYAKFLTGVKPENYYNEIIKYQRLSNILKQVSDEYTAAAKVAGLEQIKISKLAISNQYYSNQYAVNWFSGTKGKTFYTPINKNAVDVSVYGTEKIWAELSAKQREQLKPLLPKHGTLADVLRNNSTKDLTKLKQIITQAMITGQPYTKTAAEIKKLLNTTANNALRIVRTETIRNQNSGAYLNTLAAIDKGISLKRMAVETLDGRTRPQSAAIDGQIVGADQPFIYPGGLKVMIIGNSGVAEYDINDRGRSIDLVEGLEPDERSGVNPVTGEKEIASYINFQEWADDMGLKINDYGQIVS